MSNTAALPANGMAERIVRHFQAEGFAGISEALIVRLALRAGSRSEIEAAFANTAGEARVPPLGEYFDLRAYGHFSDFRSYEAARDALSGDFTVGLRRQVPAIFFGKAPLVVDDPLATGTRYDAMVKLLDNAGDTAYAILLNDPDASFLEYLGTHHGSDWQTIAGNLEATALALGQALDLV